MIPFNFVYCRPDTLDEAFDAFSEFRIKGKTALYYAGGSEIITMCRTGNIRPDAVIDIKNIPECAVLSADNRMLNIGSACTLNKIGMSGLFPLLKECCGRIADHTNQCRITIGGNLCGTIIYRETSLPLLLSDAEITLYGADGRRTVPFESIYQGRIRLNPGEMAVQIHIPVWALSARYFHMKKTANEKIDYPVVSIAAIIRGDCLRAAFSGVCSYPFRDERMESVLNDRTKSREKRVNEAAQLLPEMAHNDAEATGEYRLFVLKNSLKGILEALENDMV